MCSIIYQLISLTLLLSSIIYLVIWLHDTYFGICHFKPMNETKFDNFYIRNYTEWSNTKRVNSSDETISIRLMAYLALKDTNYKSNNTNDTKNSTNLNDKTYLTLKLTHIDSPDPDPYKQSYELYSRCAQLKMKMVRNNRFIYVEEMELEFDYDINGEDKCKLTQTIPNRGRFFEIELDKDTTLARYSCEKPELMEFKCMRYHSSWTKRGPVVEYNIARIEYETLTLPSESIKIGGEQHNRTTIKSC